MCINLLWRAAAVKSRAWSGGAARALCGRGLEPLLHLGVVGQAGLLEDGATVGEDDEVGDAADLEAGGELGVGFGVDFEDESLACHVGGGAGDFGGGGAAGSAPVGPEGLQGAGTPFRRDDLPF